jgi:hypothetical protein
MRWVRERLPHVAGAWLVFQLCLLASLPTPLCPPAGSIGAECTCDHGDGAACPMHHPAQKPDSSSRQCSCRGTSDPGTAILSLIATTAVVPPAASASVSLRVAESVPAFTVDPIESPSAPTSPPPRA